MRSLQQSWNKILGWLDSQCGTNPEQDFEFTIRCRFFAITCWELAAATLLHFIHVTVLLPQLTLAKLLVVICLVTFAGLPFLMFKLRNVQIPCIILVNIMGWTVVLSTLWNGAIDAPVVPFLIMTPAFAGFLLGVRAGVWVLFGCIGLFAGLLYLRVNDIVVPPGYPEDNVRNAYAMVLSLTAFACFITVVSYSAIINNAYRRLNELKTAAERANRSKTDFLANMSHEIRTPLNGVIGMLSVLQNTRLDEAQDDFVRTAKQSGKSLLELLSDILDFSQLESGTLKLNHSAVAVRDIVDNVTALLRDKALQKGIELKVAVSPALPDEVLCDPLRLRQILFNLLGNAVKFTDAGHVAMAVGLREWTDEHVELRFEVADTGIGIDPEHRSRLFDGFEKADMSLTRSYEGGGLGLAITKDLVDLMGGKIGVVSIPGKGSVFWVDLRLQVPGTSGKVEELAA